MSLTNEELALIKEELALIWNAIKRIEFNKRKRLPPNDFDINIIKEKIEEVIGQMK